MQEEFLGRGGGGLDEVEAFGPVGSGDLVGWCGDLFGVDGLAEGGEDLDQDGEGAGPFE